MWQNVLRLGKISLILVTVGALLLIIKRNLTSSGQRPVNWPDYSNPYVVKPSSGPELELLPNLTRIAWPKLNRPNISGKIPEGFNVSFTIGNYQTVQALLLKFQSVMISLNLQDQWFLGAGTLVGSQRHHDLIPWDDDVDIYLDLKYRNVTAKALKALTPEFGIHQRRSFDKFFFSLRPVNNAFDPTTIGSFRIHSFPWHWPFMDIFYYKRIDDRHFYDESLGGYIFKSSDVFPTLYRPLGQNWFPTPRRPLSYLEVYFEKNQRICDSGRWLHVNESGKERIKMPCSQLAGQYAFVQRCPVPENELGELGEMEFCDEYLLSGNGTSIHTIRTFLHCTDPKELVFMVKNDAFRCPSKQHTADVALGLPIYRMGSSWI